MIFKNFIVVTDADAYPGNTDYPPQSAGSSEGRPLVRVSADYVFGAVAE